MKILFVGRSIYHFSYYESIVRNLCNKGHTVEMVYDAQWSSNHLGEALNKCLKENNNLSFIWGIRRSDKYRNFIFGVRELLTCISYLSRISNKDQSDFYLERWQSYLPQPFRKYIDKQPFKFLLLCGFTQYLLRNIEKLVPPDPKIIKFIKNKKPDVVVSSPANMRFSEEIEYIKAAKALKIPTVIYTYSWDNLTTKGLFHIIPDLTLLWNNTNLDEAVKIHNVPPNKALITGSSFFDKWFNASHLLMERKEFCKRIGIDPNRSFIVYLGSSVNIARDEAWLVKEIIDNMRQHPDENIRLMNVVIRPHPANTKIYENINMPGVVVWPKDGALPESETSQRDFFNTVKHSVATIGINTSGMIDAIILNKPCIAVIAKQYHSTQMQAVHFKYLFESKAIEVASSVREALRLIAAILKGNDNAVLRNQFILSFVRPYGVEISAGLVGATAIDLLGKKFLPLQVKTEIEDYFLRGKSQEQMFQKDLEIEKNTYAYKNYLYMRKRIFDMLFENDSEASAYWKEELCGFKYIFDASPLIINRLREHCYHVTGLHSYEYRLHHAHKKKPFVNKLKYLKHFDPEGKLFVPEPSQLAGFGYEIDGNMVNIDTLKFYESLIAMKKSGLLDKINLQNGDKKVMVEIGSGWGGFAYQIKKLFPKVCYILIDLPQTLLLSGTYLMTLFPDAKVFIYGDGSLDTLSRELNSYDFVFLPHYITQKKFSPNIDLAINMISFQEMSGKQVLSYIKWLWENNCIYLYSHNRGRSPYNDQLPLTTDSIISKGYNIKEEEVLSIPYTVLDLPPDAVMALENNTNATAGELFLRQPGKKAKATPHEYTHIIGNRRNVFENRS